MVEVIKNAPFGVAAFKAKGEVTKADYEQVVIPKVEECLKLIGEVRFLLSIETDLKNFTAGAWFQDLAIGLKNLTKWKRAAIVSENELVIKFTDAFSFISPGEFKGFEPTQLDAALKWASE